MFVFSQVTNSTKVIYSGGQRERPQVRPDLWYEKPEVGSCPSCLMQEGEVI